MEIQEKLNILYKKFEGITDWEERYKHIIDMGKALAPMPEAMKVDANKVKGCQSQVWLFAELVGERISFFADSDASITKGIIAMLLSIYNESTPDDILKLNPDFIDKLEIRQHLSMNRSNGLNAMLKQISLYAYAFKTKLSMQASKPKA